MKLLITCFQWTAVALANELKILWYKTFDNFTSGMYVDGEMKDIYKINLSSRITNKIYLEVNNAVIKNFDQLFDFVHGINWDKYVSKWHKINISTNIYNSQINSDRSVQSIVNKAVLKKLVWWERQWSSDPSKEEINIFVQIIDDKCSIFVNTTGEWLHNRLYRQETGEAPLKENIAASLVRICNRHFKTPLLDPMCGSWTICIEAAMIAKNIAPGLKRHFAFESFRDFDKLELGEIRKELKDKIFQWDYKIVGYDIDPKMIEIAKKNAYSAGVDDITHFEVKDIKDVKKWDGYVVCNPPYGKRLNNDDMKSLYENLIGIYENGASGCFISSREPADRMVWYDFKIKNLNNNGEIVKVYLKK